MKFAVVVSSIASVAATRVDYSDLHSHQWYIVTSQKSSVWRDDPSTTPSGDIVQIDAAANCPTLMDKAYFKDIAGTTQQAQFIRPVDGYARPFAYNVTAGFTEEGFGKFSPLGHGIYCPTVDSSFFYNEAEDAFMWHNFANNQWTMGKPSVEWWFTVDASSPRFKEPCVETAKLPDCPAGQNADLDANDCPKCKTTNGRGPDGGECTAEKIAACDVAVIPTNNPLTPINKDDLPICAAGTKPARDVVSCCMTCYIPKKTCPTGIDGVPNACGSGSYDSLPDCADADAQANAWDADNCCVSCKRPAPVKVVTTADECTKEAIDDCYASIPVCLDDQQAALTGSNGRCCPECKRAERQFLCQPEDVAKCLIDQPICNSNNFNHKTPQVVDGECCESCRQADPCAGTTCGKGQYCAIVNEGVVECRNMIEKGVTLTVADDSRRTEIASLPTFYLQRAVGEVIKRYCEVPTDDRKVDCALYEQKATSSLQINTVGKNGVDITMNVASEETTVDFIKQALADEAAAEGISGTMQDELFAEEVSPAAAATASGALATAAVFASLFL